MSIRADLVRQKLERLVDTVGIPADSRPAILALVTHAYIMGASDDVVEVHKSITESARLTHELAGPLGIRIEGAKEPASDSSKPA